MIYWAVKLSSMNAILVADAKAKEAAGKVPVFGILERNGTVRVTVVPDKAETLIGLTVRTVCRGTSFTPTNFEAMIV